MAKADDRTRNYLIVDLLERGVKLERSSRLKERTQSKGESVDYGLSSRASLASIVDPLE
jgi:hypothetical protein